MIDNFCFYIDNSFFSDGININTIKKFKILFEVSRQLKAKTYYNKIIFQEAMNNIEDNFNRPSFKNKVKDFINSFEGVDEFCEKEEDIKIYISKIADKNNNTFNNATEVWSFINSQLPQRVFNQAYPKHGRKKDDGGFIPAWKGESQLLTTDNESQSLLANAIFDLRKREDFHVNFDSNNSTFILFPDENTSANTFHAFHINKNEWNNKIHNSIIKYFGK